MKIIIDAMGGDFAPTNEILGAINAVNKDSDLEVILVGDQKVLSEELLAHGNPQRISIVHASERISMNDSPTKALKEKKNSSINIAMQLLKDGKADGIVSGGNTGAVLAASIFKLGRIKNVERPAIMGIFPAITKPLLILDIGANVDCKPKQLVQFAKMGNIYSQRILGVEKPIIRLLNIGEEEEKGNELTVETFKLLKETKGLSFKGNLEPKHVLDSDTDVVVCDGFAGNLILKFAEGMASHFFKLLKKYIKKSFLSMLGGIFMMPAFKQIKKRVDADEYGGSILLGISKVVMIAHGSSNPKALGNAIIATKKAVKQNIVGEITEAFSLEKKGAK